MALDKWSEGAERRDVKLMFQYLKINSSKVIRSPPSAVGILGRIDVVTSLCALLDVNAVYLVSILLKSLHGIEHAIKTVDELLSK